MKTKSKLSGADKAEQQARKQLGGYKANGKKIAVYQFPAGHWSYATPESEVYRNLSESDEIYSGVKAQTWEVRYL